MTVATRQESIFYTHTLPNGLQMLGQLMPEVQSAAAVFWVVTGTRDENAAEMGVSHFLEHMAFRRTEHFTGPEIDRAFEEMGAEHNAATWKEMTFYWARVLSENVPWGVEVLSELTHPRLGAEDFEQERNVILEEIARYEDMPTHILMNKFLENYFGDHPLAWETLGTPETIKALTVEQMRAYWDKRYGTRNTIFAIAGNFDWESVVTQLETLSEGWQAGETGRATQPVTFTPSFQVYRHEEFAQEQLAIGTPLVSRSDPRYYAAAVLATILGDDSGSRLFWALHDTGLAEVATAQPFEFEDNGLLLVHVSTEPAQAQEALRVTLEELSKLQSGGVDEAELERAKAKLNSSLIIGGESTNERVMELIRSWLTDRRLESLEETRRKVESVTVKDLQDLLQDCPVSPHQAITAIGPVLEDELRATLQA